MNSAMLFMECSVNALTVHVHGRCVPRLRGTCPRNSWKTSPSKKSGLTHGPYTTKPGEIPQEYLTNQEIIQFPSRLRKRPSSYSFGMVEWHGTRSPNLSPEPRVDFEQTGYGKTEIMPLVKGSAFFPLSDNLCRGIRAGYYGLQVG